MLAPGANGPFIGRAGELDRLQTAFADTASGRPATVVIGGESGVGKTRLVTEFVSLARQQGATVLVGGCTDFGEGGPPYWAVLEALRPVWGQIGVGGPDPDLTEGAPPGLSPSVGEQQVPGPIPLFELIVRVLRRVAEAGPVVLAVEDVHWADRSTRDLLAFLLANLNDDPVMMIVTYRSEALGRQHSLQPLLAELRRSRRADFIDLRPFTKEEMVAKLHALLGRPPDEGLVELTWSRSDGNAFFAEELVAAILDGYGTELPPTLRHILMCRIDVLSEAARRVVRLVAVAGDGVMYPLLAAVTELPESELVAALRECVDHHLLSVHSDGRTYRLRHSLVQEVLYDELLPGEKQLLHTAFGKALEGQSARPDAMAASRLARHWYAAGDAERALVAAMAAATAAAAIYGFAEAQRHYERALELWDQVANAAELARLSRPELFERAAEVAHMAGEHRRASVLISAAISEMPDPATRSDDSLPPEEAETAEQAARENRCAVWHQRLGQYLWAAGDSREALKAYEEAVRCLPAGIVSPARAMVEGAYAEALMLSGRYRSSRDQAEVALQVARDAEAPLQETQILATLGFDLAFLGESASGVSALERAQVIAEELGNPDDIGRAHLNLAALLSGPLNRLAEAAIVAEQGVERVRQLGLERTYGVALQAIAVNTLFRLGRWGEADTFLQDALAAKPTGIAAINLCLARAKLSVGRGEYAAAEADLRTVEALAGGGLGLQYEAPLLTLRAGLDLWLGRPEQARESVNRAIMASINASDDVWLLAPLIWHGLRAEADVAARARVRRDTAALEAATTISAGLWLQMQNLADDSHDAAPSIRQAISAYLKMCEGEAARAEGHDLPQVWAEAAQMWHELQQPYPAAYSDWREAEGLLGQRSRSSRATESLRRAHRVAVELGATPFRHEVESLAARARISLVVEGSTESPSRAVEAPQPLAPGPKVPASSPGRPAMGIPPLPSEPDPLADSTPIAARQAAKVRFRLSDREFDVWLLLPEGLTNNQIGERLFISGKTASVHVTNILRKLGAKTRVQAITLAYQLGLVDQPAHE